VEEARLVLFGADTFAVSHRVYSDATEGRG
jgi:hypothetical protein